MVYLTKDTKVDVDKYDDHLHYRGFIYLDLDKLRLVQRSLESKMDTLYGLCIRIMASNTPSIYYELNSRNILEYLINFENIPEYKFRNYKTEKLSLNSKFNLKPIYDSDLAVEFLGTYMTYSSTKSKLGRINGVLGRRHDVAGIGWNGEVLSKLEFNVTVQQNARFYYNNEDLISMPKEIKNAYSAPEGKVLVWGDFKQADMKVAYNTLLRDDSNFEMMLKYPDTYEAISRLIAQTDNQPFDYEKFWREREYYKVYCLETVYGTKTGKSVKDSPFVASFNRWLLTCKNYQSHKNITRDRINADLPLIVSCYFGHTEIVSQYDSPTSKAMNKSLNTPCQGTSSELVIIIVNAILDMFYSYGFTEDDINVFCVRHDEPLFLVDRKLIKDFSWIFHQFSDIQVGDWIPMGLDFSMGYCYSEIDEGLMHEYEESIINNIDKITVRDKTKTTNKFERFIPLKPVADFSMCVIKMGDISIICVYNENQRFGNRADVWSINCNEVTDLEKYLVDMFMSNEKVFVDYGYGVVNVFNNIIDKKIDTRWFNEVQFNFRHSSDPLVKKASVVAMSGAQIICNELNIQWNSSVDVINVNKQFLSSVTKLNLFGVN